MKCPKCGYLGFEAVDRCRNCGYEFSLAHELAVPELPIRHEATRLEPLEDLTLLDHVLSPAVAPQMESGDWEQARRRPGTPDLPGGELPLFGPPIVDDRPLIAKASPPRAPLAVRRATPDVPRMRANQPRARPFELSLDLESPPAPAPLPAAVLNEQRRPQGAPSEDASLGAHLVAAILDAAILAATDAVVIYFTMRLSGIALSDLGILPWGPLTAFLLMQNGGYLIAFTASGQTLGKMAAGIKVVTAASGSPPDLSRAILRTLLWVILALPVGLGFLTALFSRDHRGLHDRFAGTRVVRISVA